MRVLFVLVASCFFVSSACASVFKVGNMDNDGCDFASIQEAVAAAADKPEAGVIYVANTGSYTDQALSIADQSLTIQGGYATCAQLEPDAPADLAGNGVDPVLRIAPASATAQQVVLRGLRIHGGGVAALDGPAGGGIYVTNNVTLTIADTVIEQNGAVSGAGICSDADHGFPIVELLGGTRIQHNSAIYFGGGVYLTGGRLDIVSDDVYIDGNHVSSSGGGIASINGLVLVGNTLGFPADHDVTGASVSHNTAGTSAGGIFLSGSNASLQAHELIVDDNSAGSSGGGIVAMANAQVSLLRDYVDDNALQCPNWRECSRISNNSVGAGASGTVGGAIALYSGAVAQLAQTIVRGNTAQNGSVAYVDTATLFLEGVIATGNRSVDIAGQAGPAIRTRFLGAGTPAMLRIAYSTFSGNLERNLLGQDEATIDLIAQQYAQTSIYSSVFNDAYYAVTAYSAYTDDCVIARGSDAYGSHTRFALTDTPGFNNASAGDYRLRNESMLNDYCDVGNFVPTFRDLVLVPRCHDDPRRDNVYGICDAGAYESDHIFGASLQ